jgi:hypothetical protein
MDIVPTRSNRRLKWAQLWKLQVSAQHLILGLGALIVAVPFYFLMGKQAATVKDLS